MYSTDIIKTAINLYVKLKNKNIIGTERIKFINSVFNIHINTLYKWLNKYYDKNSNTINFITYKTNFKYNNTKIILPIEQFIISSINDNNNFNINKIKSNIQNKFNITLSKASIYYVLHKNNLTYKKMYVKNNPNDEIITNGLKNNLKKKFEDINDIDKLISYDEMSICLNSKPNKGWCKKGKICYVETKNKTIFNKRYSIGMSINIKGKIDFTITEKSLKSNKFHTFMKKINKNNHYIFMDNASIHTNKFFKNSVIKNNWNIIYNVPYHSHLNPIEYVFSLLRKKLLNDNNVSTYDDIINTLLSFKKNINPQHITNIFNKCLKEIKEV
jgi:transposase